MMSVLIKPHRSSMVSSIKQSTGFCPDVFLYYGLVATLLVAVKGLHRNINTDTDSFIFKTAKLPKPFAQVFQMIFYFWANSCAILRYYITVTVKRHAKIGK